MNKHCGDWAISITHMTEPNKVFLNLKPLALKSLHIKSFRNWYRNIKGILWRLIGKNVHTNNCNMADTNSKYGLVHKDELWFIQLWLASKRISKFLIQTKKKELGFACESNSYLVRSHRILWTNTMSTRTVLSLDLWSQ